MKNNTLIKLLMATALLVLAIPVVAAGQVYRDRYYQQNDYSDRYDQVDPREVRNAISQLDNASARLENDLNYTPGRRIFGIFQIRTVDNTAIAEVRDFRRAVRQLRNSSYYGRADDRSRENARFVLNQGVQLDRDLRLRTGSTTVDADLSELRSSLHIIA